LFPDITKLTAGETVIDVYGRAQTIPESEWKAVFVIFSYYSHPPTLTICCLFH
jgi:hypothetical protein